MDSLDARLNGLPSDINLLQYAVETMWLCISGVIVFMVGSVRVFHVQSILIKNVVDSAISIAMYFIIGYALASDSGNVFSGNKYFLLRNADSEPLTMARFFLAIAFASSAVTIVSGALAERCKLVAYFIFAAVMSGFVYPLIAHWFWSSEGWLSPYRDAQLFNGVLGYLDYAGSSVVHAVGGFSALIGLIILGPRHGRFGVDGIVCELEGVVGNSGVYRALGAMLLFVSFISFNASSVGVWQRIPLCGLIATNTIISASFGIFAVMGWKLAVRNFQVDIMHCLDGMLAGLVAVTASAGMVNSWAAAVIGIVGGIFYVLTAELMLKYKLDDVVNAVAIHFSPGVWGVVAVGFFARPSNLQLLYSVEGDANGDFPFDAGVFYGGNGKQLGVQLLGLSALLLFVFITITPVFTILKQAKMLRVPAEVQISVHSGYKSSENYSWKRYQAPNPKVISLAHNSNTNGAHGNTDGDAVDGHSGGNVASGPQGDARTRGGIGFSRMRGPAVTTDNPQRAVTHRPPVDHV